MRKILGNFFIHLLFGWLLFTLLLLLAIVFRTSLESAANVDELLITRLIYLYKDLLILLLPGFILFGIINRLIARTRIAGKKGEITIILGVIMYILLNVSFVITMYLLDQMVFAFPTMIEAQLMMAAAMIVFVVLPFVRKWLFEYPGND